MRFGIQGRVLVGMGVVLVAVPAIVLSGSRLDAVSIQQPPIRQQITQVKVDEVKPAPVAVRKVKVIPHEQEQEQEPEPWRSTMKGTGPDVVTPRLTYTVNPKYTPEALRAKIQGWVTLEAIVSSEGDVTAVRVTKSLDRVFGLDDEAVKTAMQWKFVAGTYQGQPTPLRVVIEMQFQVKRGPLSVQPR